MSFFRYENILLNQNGTPLVNVNVWVCTGIITPNFFTIPPGPLATVYSDTLGTQPITQPILTSPLGNYSFCAAPGTYTVVFVSTGLQSSDIVTIPSVVNQTIEVDGVQYTTVQQAIAALPANGGTVDMRGNSSAAALALGTIDPGTKAVTILLGPFTYTLNQITLRRCFQLIGAGMYAANGTIIQSTGGNSVPPFILDPSTPTQAVYLKGFSVLGTVSNTSQTAFSMISPASGGLWYSTFEEISVNGFLGIGLNFDGSSGGFNQFNIFRHIIVTRPANGNYALQIIGVANAFKFDNCQFDGVFNTQDGRTNIFIGQGSNAGLSFPPYDMAFSLVTSQFAGQAFLIAGCDTVTIDEGHFEQVQQVITVGPGNNFGSLNVTIHDSFAGNGAGIGTASPGVGLGNGYLVKNNGTALNVSIGIVNFHSYSTPDTTIAGTLGAMSIWGLTVGTSGSYTSFPPQSRAPVGFGTGSAGTAVTTTTKGAGTGPTTPQTIVNYQEIWIAGVNYWIPLCQ